MSAPRILMGVIGRPHGVRGLVHVMSYATDPADLTRYGALSMLDGRRFVLRWVGDGIAAIEGISDRNAAEKLTSTQLFLDRSALPEPDADEYYYADLIGLAAQAEDGAVIGTVAAVHDYGAGASLEIARENAAPLLVPFTKASVPVVDIAGRRVVVTPPVEHVVEGGDETAGAA